MSIKLTCINIKNLYKVISSLKAARLPVLIEFFSDNLFILKSKDEYGKCLRILEFKLSDYFSKKESEPMPEYLSIVVSFDKLEKYLKASINIPKINWILDYEVINGKYHCNKMIVQIFNSQNAEGDYIIENQDLTSFDKVLGKRKDDFISKFNYLFDFTLDTKLKRKLRECDENTLSIYLTKEEFGYNIIFTDDDFLLITNKDLVIYENKEAVIKINSKYLDFLSIDSYTVRVSNEYLFFIGQKSNDFIIILAL